MLSHELPAFFAVRGFSWLIGGMGNLPVPLYVRYNFLRDFFFCQRRFFAVFRMT